MAQTDKQDIQLPQDSRAITSSAIENIFTPQEFVETLVELNRHSLEANAALEKATKVSSRTLLLMSQKLFKMTKGEAVLILPLIAQWRPDPVTPYTPLLNAINLSGQHFLTPIVQDRPANLVLIPTGQIGWANLIGGGRVVNFRSLEDDYPFDPASAIRIFTNLKKGLLHSIERSKAGAKGLNDFTDTLQPLLQLLDVENLLQTGKKAGLS